MTDSGKDVILVFDHSVAQLEVHPGTGTIVLVNMFLDLSKIEEERWSLWTLKNKLQSRGHNVKELCRYLESDDIEYIENASREIANRFFYDEKSLDTTLYRGISIGKCIYYSAKADSIRILKLIRGLEKMKRQHPEQKIIALGFHPPKYKRIYDEFGFDTSGINSEPNRQSGSVEKVIISRQRIIRASREATRRIGLRWIQGVSVILSKLNDKKESEVIIRMGLQTSIILEHWLREQTANMRFVLWMEAISRPQLVMKLVLSGQKVVSKKRASDQGRNGASVIPRFDNTKVSWHDKSITDALKAQIIDQIAQKITTQARYISSEIDHAYANLIDGRCKLLVVLNDVQPEMRAWCYVAKALKRTTVAIQHGHLDYVEDGGHQTADISAIWANGIRKKLLERGVRREAMKITGSPNADWVLLEKNRYPNIIEKNRKLKILVLTTGNPGVQAYMNELWVCDFAASVLKAIEQLSMKHEVTVKLHPGESAEPYRSNIQTATNIAICERGDLLNMLYQADIVVSPPSTAVIEARLMGKPVVMVRIDNPSNRTSDLEDLEGVFTLSDVEKLPAVLQVFHVDGTLPSNETNSKSLEEFTGFTDGYCSARTLSLIETLVNGANPDRNARNGYEL